MTDNIYGQGDCEGTNTYELNISNYCNLKDANATLKTSLAGDLSILYINIVSLPYNMNDLHTILTNFDDKPDLIALSETRITEKCNTHYHPYLDDYTYLKSTSKTHFGSVGVFIRNTLSFNIRKDLNCSEYALYEMLWLEISGNEKTSSKSTVGIIYRHCGPTSIPSFTARMENIINSTEKRLLLVLI